MEYSESYVANLVDFLGVYRWIYDVKITNLFKEEFWKKIPAHVSQFTEYSCA